MECRGEMGDIRSALDGACKLFTEVLRGDEPLPSRNGKKLHMVLALHVTRTGLHLLVRHRMPVVMATPRVRLRVSVI